jgi:hypothetical protein
MDKPRNRGTSAALLSLEDRAATARGGFGCLFSTSDEYETALIAVRRAQGRYGQQRSPWPIIMFIGCALMMAATVLLFG